VKVPGRALYEDDLFPLSIAMSVHELSPSLYSLQYPTLGQIPEFLLQKADSSLRRMVSLLPVSRLKKIGCGGEPAVILTI
jgi:hypothetical protein